MANLKLYHAIVSTFSRKVRVAMAEKGITCERVALDLAAGDQHKPEYLKINPHGRVPTLVADGTPIYESTAIIEYLEETHPSPPLLPRNPLERARARMIEEVADNAFAMAGRAVRINTQVKPPTERDPKAAEEGRRSILWHNNWLSEELTGREFLAGGMLTVADIAAMCAINLQERAGVPLDAKFANLVRFYERMKARPSHKAMFE